MNLIVNDEKFRIFDQFKPNQRKKKTKNESHNTLMHFTLE